MFNLKLILSNTTINYVIHYFKYLKLNKSKNNYFI